MSFWKWSRTAATNATADGSINWAEGQAPSSVNDSARAVMAAAAKYRDDIAGTIATAGTSTAYTLTTYQVFDSFAHMDGAMIAFVPHATNGATVTLNVDGLGTKPLRPFPSVEFPAKCLVLGTPYVATYSNANSEWVVQGSVKALLGTSTNDDAGAGLVGEYQAAALASPGSALTTGTRQNITTLSLTAGDWDVDGTVTVVGQGSTSLTTINAGISTTSQTFGGEGTTVALTTPAQTGVQESLIVPTVRLSLSTTTTVYLVLSTVHTVSNPNGYGNLRARRVR